MNTWVLGNLAKAKSTRPLFFLLMNLEVHKKAWKIHTSWGFKSYCWLHTNTWVLGNLAKAKSIRPPFFLLMNLEVHKKARKIHTSWGFKSYCWLHRNTRVVGNLAKAKSIRPPFFLLMKFEVHKKAWKIHTSWGFKSYCWLHMNTRVLGNLAKAKSTRPPFFLLMNLEVHKKAWKIHTSWGLLNLSRRTLSISAFVKYITSVHIITIWHDINWAVWIVRQRNTGWSKSSLCTSAGRVLKCAACGEVLTQNMLGGTHTHLCHIPLEATSNPCRSRKYCTFTMTSTLTYILLLTGIQGLFAHPVYPTSERYTWTFRSSCIS
jgi:hypothetical protein